MQIWKSLGVHVPPHLPSPETRVNIWKFKDILLKAKYNVPANSKVVREVDDTLLCWEFGTGTNTKKKKKKKKRGWLMWILLQYEREYLLGTPTSSPPPSVYRHLDMKETQSLFLTGTQNIRCKMKMEVLCKMPLPPSREKWCVQSPLLNDASSSLFFLLYFIFFWQFLNVQKQQIPRQVF